MLASRGLCFDEIYGSSVLYIPGMFSSSRNVVESVFCAALFGDSNVARSGMILLSDLLVSDVFVFHLSLKSGRKKLALF